MSTRRVCVYKMLYICTINEQVLYNEDMLEEEAIVSWYKSTDGMTKDMQAQRKKACGEQLWPAFLLPQQTEMN